MFQVSLSETFLEEKKKGLPDLMRELELKKFHMNLNNRRAGVKVEKRLLSWEVVGDWEGELDEERKEWLELRGTAEYEVRNRVRVMEQSRKTEEVVAALDAQSATSSKHLEHICANCGEIDAKMMQMKAKKSREKKRKVMKTQQELQVLKNILEVGIFKNANDLASDGENVLGEFDASWCRHCKKLTPNNDSHGDGSSSKRDKTMPRVICLAASSVILSDSDSESDPGR